MMGSGKRVIKKCIVITNEPIEAYGGVRVSDTVLEQIAENLRRNRITMHNQHDTRQPVDSWCLRAEVVDLPDGAKAVEADFEVDSEQWDAVLSEWRTMGAPGGLSCTCIEALRPAPGAHMALAADVYYFEDEEIVEAADIMSVAGPTSAQRMYQFAAVPPPHIVVDLTAALACIPISILAAAVYDGLKYLLTKLAHRGKESVDETQIDLQIQSKAEGTVNRILHIRTSNEEVLKHAIDRIGDAIESPTSLLIWNEEDMDWEAPD